jgi:hypothetical protein
VKALFALILVGALIELGVLLFRPSIFPAYREKPPPTYLVVVLSAMAVAFGLRLLQMSALDSL